jgi:hypothetical protein
MNIPQNLQAPNKRNELNVTLSSTQLQKNAHHVLNFFLLLYLNYDECFRVNKPFTEHHLIIEHDPLETSLGQ